MFKCLIGIFNADAYGENNETINSKIALYVTDYIQNDTIDFQFEYYNLDDNAKIKLYPIASIYSIRAIKIK